MARKLCFSLDGESHGDMREDCLTRPVTPFSVMREKYEEVNKDKPKGDSFYYGFNDFYSHSDFRFSCTKELMFYILDFVQEIEESVRGFYEHMPVPFSWNLVYRSYPLAGYEVTITDHDGECVHKNWKVFIDISFGDLTIWRKSDTEKNNVVYHWKYPEQRLKDAITSHLRLKFLKIARLSSK